MTSVPSEPAFRTPAATEILALGDGASRLIDVLAASVALLFLAPLMLAIAAAIHLLDGGPVLSGQRRVGKDGRTYWCWRFRSVVAPSGRPIAAARRPDPAWPSHLGSTAIGGLLRRLSLDELPQLLNILNGDMSLVGPRPIAAEEAARYGRYLAEYCSVRPGITGLWQVNGDSETSRRRRVAIDIAYIRSKSIGLDLRILFVILSRPLARA